MDQTEAKDEYHRSRFYPPARVVGCLVIALAGGFWLVERI